MRIWSPTGSTRYRSGCACRNTRSRSEGADSAAPSRALAGSARERVAINSAANAIAARRLPTPGGPWKRYACAVPSASAARSSRFASACSGKLSKTSTDLLADRVGRARTVDRGYAVGKHLCECTVRLVDRAVKLGSLALDAIGGRAALERHVGIDEHEEGLVGQEPARCIQVQLEHALDAEVARDPLV